jgi:hypothetical protein
MVEMDVIDEACAAHEQAPILPAQKLSGGV